MRSTSVPSNVATRAHMLDLLSRVSERQPGVAVEMTLRVSRGFRVLGPGPSRSAFRSVTICPMEAAAPEAGVAGGYEALASGDWETARAAFESALHAEELPDALDGIGRALWWLRDSERAVVYRERAYSGFRREGQLARAARIALWLSREYALVWGNEAAANGWLSR